MYMYTVYRETLKADRREEGEMVKLTGKFMLRMVPHCVTDC